MKTLYVSDLDGTLLQSNETTSDFTNKAINNLVAEGMIFSYATARSYVTAQKVTKGLNAEIPLIVYNGAFIIDNKSGKTMYSNYFDSSVCDLIKDLLNSSIYPIVYSYIDSVEKFSFVESKCIKGMKAFINSRKGDKRINALSNEADLFKGEIFYITCIDSEEKLKPFYNKYKSKFNCIYQRDIYTNEQWLEIVPKSTTKANAVLQLKKLMGCDKIISFGDAINDIDMFEISDECYAVENAASELKQLTTGIIESNNENGVAKWLIKNYK